MLIMLKPDNLTSFSMSSFDSSLGVGSNPLRTATLEGWAFYVRSLMPKLQRIEVCNLAYNAAHLSKWRDNANLQGLREPREVFLVEPPPISNRARILDGVGAALVDYAEWSQTWGAKVEHLRIDNVEMSKAHFFNRLHLDPAQLRKLKVLVIRTLPTYRRGQWVWALDPKEKPYGRLERPTSLRDELKPETALTEWRFAEDIMNQGYRSLRMVVINGYHFWI